MKPKKSFAPFAMMKENAGAVKGLSPQNSPPLRSDASSTKSESIIEELSSQESQGQARNLEVSDASVEGKKNATSPPSNPKISLNGRLRFALIILSLSLSIFLVAVDRGIVAVAMYRSMCFSH